MKKLTKLEKDLQQLAWAHGAHKFDVGLRNIAVGLATRHDVEAFCAAVRRAYPSLTVDSTGALWAWIYR